MPFSSKEKVTQLLEAVRNGDRSALNKLFPLVYDELHVLAHRKRRQWHGDYTLNTTALVHEAYLKLTDPSQIQWNNRAHFFYVAAKAMRQILINYAEQQRAEKRGGKVRKISFDEMRVLVENGNGTLTAERAEALTTLDAALKKLEKINKRQSRIVECRFFGGMTVKETAAALAVSTPTVKRGWAMAKVWLYREMGHLLDA